MHDILQQVLLSIISKEVPGASMMLVHSHCWTMRLCMHMSLMFGLFFGSWPILFLRGPQWVMGASITKFFGWKKKKKSWRLYILCPSTNAHTVHVRLQDLCLPKARSKFQEKWRYIGQFTFTHVAQPQRPTWASNTHVDTGPDEARDVGRKAPSGNGCGGSVFVLYDLSTLLPAGTTLVVE